VSSSTSTIKNLNDDTLLNILLQMDPESIANACKTNIQFNRVCKQNQNKILKSKSDLINILPENAKFFEKLMFISEFEKAPKLIGKRSEDSKDLYTKHELVSILLSNSIDKNQALHIACYYGLTSLASILISKGADINSKGIYMSAFVVGGSPEHEGDQILIDTQQRGVVGPFSAGLLYFPVLFENMRVVKFIIDKGIKLSNQSELHMAVQNKNYEMVELLLKAGANINFEFPNAKNISHLFKGDALKLAAKNNDIEMMKLLIRYGAGPYVDYSDKSRFDLALLEAASLNKIKAVEYLVKYARITDFETAMEAAIKKWYIEIVYILAKSGGDLQKVSKKSVKNIQLAIDLFEDEQEIIRYIKEGGKSYDTYLSLLKSDVYKSKDAFDIFLKHGKKIKSSDFNNIRKERLNE
jgi:ankyrin repeat protein